MHRQGSPAGANHCLDAVRHQLKFDPASRGARSFVVLISRPALAMTVTHGPTGRRQCRSVHRAGEDDPRHEAGAPHTGQHPPATERPAAQPGRRSNLVAPAAATTSGTARAAPHGWLPPRHQRVADVAFLGMSLIAVLALLLRQLHPTGPPDALGGDRCPRGEGVQEIAARLEREASSPIAACSSPNTSLSR